MDNCYGLCGLLVERKLHQVRLGSTPLVVIVRGHAILGGHLLVYLLYNCCGEERGLEKQREMWQQEVEDYGQSQQQSDRKGNQIKDIKLKYTVTYLGIEAH